MAPKHHPAPFSGGDRKARRDVDIAASLRLGNAPQSARPRAAGRFQGIAANGAGRRHDQHQKREEQTLGTMAGSGAPLCRAVQLLQRVHKPEGGDVWFALDDARPLACFAGIWTNWTSVWKVKEGETTNDLYAFLTAEPNAEVGAIHPKAMPVILTTPDEVEAWMTAPPSEALKLQRPLPDGSLRIVARGVKEDSAGP
ncbi:hypothetical protein ACVINW_003938 [Bradyrhizobium sp. USDA 4461]